MNEHVTIAGRKIGEGEPVYIIAELSANHGQDLNRAREIIYAAKEAGADAVKLQTYTADTITLNCREAAFQIGKGTIWEGRVLHDLYSEAYTPWEWQPELLSLAAELGLAGFSSPFDATAVAFLEGLQVPAYKIASFELVDLPLIRQVAATGKPLIMSTGMATLAEIDEAVRTAREAGAKEIALLKCTSGYPADPAEMHLRTIPHMASAFRTLVGLSDHTLGSAVPVAAVALGACIVEKHLALSRSEPGPDSAFSMEPDEFRRMVQDVRVVSQALGVINYSVSERESASRVFRRSLFAVEDIPAGAELTEFNVRSIRPGHGLHTRYLKQILGRRAPRAISRGTPLSWELLTK